MSNDLTLSPAVMINRIVAREATPLAAHLGRVADLRMRLENAQNEQQARAAQLNPEAAPAPPLTGADVDRLV
tara:strand:- start:16265 stop:16480 length:216 start_codon:yes stop_codon:yes gene_type:complete